MRMDDFLLKLVTTYGPLALGWPLWFMEHMENRKNADKLVELYASATGSIAALKQLIEERLPRK